MRGKMRLLILLSVLSTFAFVACKDNREEAMGDNNSAKITETPATDAVAPTQEAGKDNEAKVSPEPSVPINVDLPAPETEYVSKEMYEDALLNEGDLSRLAAVMKKAANGEEVTVAVIGGSITQGSLASSQESCYASIFYRWWQNAFPNAKINFVNDGIGATTSYLAVHRIDKDLLPHKPDVVVVEFSVNDSNSLLYKETYEDLLRRIMKEDNNPAVIPLFMTMEDGTSAATQHLLVCFNYNLPRISYGYAVLNEITKGAFTWRDVSPDNIHPNDKGHAMVGEILWKYLNGVYAKLDTITDEVTPVTTQPLFTETYIDATILDSSNITPVSYGSFEEARVFDRFPNDWKTTSGDDAIVFETEAQNIGIMYYKTVDGLSGQFDVYVDGEKVSMLNANFIGGWGNYAETVEVYRSKEKRLHRIEIKKNKESSGDVFSVLGLLIS